MIEAFRPAKVFLPFGFVFVVLYFGLGRPEPLLAGAVFAIVTGAGIRWPIPWARSIPILLLLSLLFALGFLPATPNATAVLHTASLLLSFRILLAVLARVRSSNHRRPESLIPFALGLAVQFFLSLLLLISSLREVDPRVLLIVRILDLKLLAVGLMAHLLRWPR
jgi:hypothetical protein